MEILFPRDITDPLNLKGGDEDGRGGDGVLLSPLKSRKRHRHRHHGGIADKDVVQARLFPSAAASTGEVGTNYTLVKTCHKSIDFYNKFHVGQQLCQSLKFWPSVCIFEFGLRN